MLAAMWMTRDVEAVTPDTTGAELARLMSRHRIRRVPVVDAARSVVGIVSRTDLLHATPAAFNPFSADAADGRLRELAFRASDVMVPVEVAVQSETLAVVAQRMEVRRLGAVPVVTDRESRRLVGILSQTDLARAFRSMLEPPGGQHRSIWELESPGQVGYSHPKKSAAPSDDDLLAATARAVAGAGGRLRAFWPFARGERLWVLVVTEELRSSQPLRAVFTGSSRLLHAAPPFAD